MRIEQKLFTRAECWCGGKCVCIISIFNCSDTETEVCESMEPEFECFLRSMYECGMPRNFQKQTLIKPVRIMKVVLGNPSSEFPPAEISRLRSNDFRAKCTAAGFITGDFPSGYHCYSGGIFCYEKSAKSMKSRSYGKVIHEAEGVKIHGSMCSDAQCCNSEETGVPSCELLSNRTNSDNGLIKEIMTNKESDAVDDRDNIGIVSPQCSSEMKSTRFTRRKYDQYVASNAMKYFSSQKMRNYYAKRYQLFSKLHEGILMDEESWYSVTPEKIAAHIADRMVFKENILIVDAFAGAGGNSIQFALKGAYVIAVDIDPVKILCAKRNAKVYGVRDRIKFIEADFFVFAQRYSKMWKMMRRISAHRFRRNRTNSLYFGNPWRRRIGAVFLSPPWGGINYTCKKEFILNDINPNGVKIYRAAEILSTNIAYYLPRQTRLSELNSLSKHNLRSKCAIYEIEQNRLNGRLKAITAYFGRFLPSNHNSKRITVLGEH